MLKAEGLVPELMMEKRKIHNCFDGIPGYNCIACSSKNPIGLHLEFWEEGDDLVTEWRPSDNHQGWLNIVHGGIQAMLLDELCGWIVIRKLQTVGVTAKMETKYRRPVAADEPLLTVRGRIREQKGRLVIMDAELLDSEGKVCTEAVCTYFAYPRKKAEKDFYFTECRLEGEDEAVPVAGR